MTKHLDDEELRPDVKEAIDYIVSSLFLFEIKILVNSGLSPSDSIDYLKSDEVIKRLESLLDVVFHELSEIVLDKIPSIRRGYVS
jgi:hypothetical protein